MFLAIGALITIVSLTTAALSSEQQAKSGMYGKAEIAPDKPVIAGQVGTWKIRYYVGEKGIKEGGSVRFFPPITVRPYFWSGVRWQYGEVSCSTNADVSLELTQPLAGHPLAEAYYIRAKVKEGTLKRGDWIEVILGDTSEGYPVAVAQDLAMEKAEFFVAVDSEGKGEYVNIDDYPILEVLGDRPIKLRVMAEATPVLGSPFRFIVKAEDKYFNASSTYQGEIEIRCSDKDAVLPQEYRFSHDDKGVHTFSDCRINSKGTHFITVVDKENLLMGRSNPIRPVSVGEERIFFGDIHTHSLISDGLGTPDEVHKYARDVAALDFYCLSDHAGSAWRAWDEMRRMAEEYNVPGKFVILMGYEFSTSKKGHRNVYFPDAPERPLGEGGDPNNIFDIFAGKDVLIIAHQLNVSCFAWKHVDWSFHDEDLQRLAEITQGQGSFETEQINNSYIFFGERGGSAQEALRRGCRLGFVGCTDSHTGQANAPWNVENLPAGETRRGLTAVFAPKLTRKSIYTALKRRGCYATTGKRILIDFNINGHSMGESFSADSAERARLIEARVWGTNKIKSIELIRDNDVLYTVTPESIEAALKYRDSSALVDTAFYYLRVAQMDVHMAWSSPIWVTKER